MLKKQMLKRKMKYCQKLGKHEVCINNTENKYDSNEQNMDTDKDMSKLSNEEPIISYSPIHDNENSTTLSTSVKDPSFITRSSTPKNNWDL